MAHTRSWDETDPATADEAKFGAQEIREHKTDVRERMELDHAWNISTTNDGYHKQVTLYTPLGAHPTMAANQGVIYSYDVSAKAELHWRDEDSNTIQLTSAGEINPAAIRNASTTQDGLVELSTDAEAQAKTDATRALTPDNLAALDASETFSGLSERVSNSEIDAGTDDSRHVTSAKLQRKLGGTAVTGHLDTVCRIEDDSGVNPTTFGMATLATGTWHQVGPTGSTNVWAILDDLPSTVSFLIVQAQTRQDGTTNGTTYASSYYARKAGSARTTANSCMLAYIFWINRSNNQEFNTSLKLSFIPVDSNLRFEVRPELVNSTPSIATLHLVGWG